MKDTLPAELLGKYLKISAGECFILMLDELV